MAALWSLCHRRGRWGIIKIMKLFGWEVTLRIIQLHPPGTGRAIICVDTAWLSTHGPIQVPLGPAAVPLSPLGSHAEQQLRSLEQAGVPGVGRGNTLLASTTSSGC